MPAALIAGIVLGVDGRIVMRLVAVEAGVPGAFSPGGSLEVVAFGAMLGAPLALLFWRVLPRLAWPFPAAGLSFGGVVIGALTLLPPPAARSALAGTADTPLITGGLFALLFLLWGAVLELTAPWVRRAIQGPPREPDHRA